MLAEQRTLRDLSGIGPSLESDLHSLGIRSVTRLAQCDGSELYQRLCTLTQTHQDPCVLDVFRCAVAQAQNPDLEMEQRQWWWWSRQRKAGKLAPACLR